MTSLDSLLKQGQEILTRIEKLLPTSKEYVDLDTAPAWQWIYRNNQGYLQPITNLSTHKLSDILNIDVAKQRLVQNTRQFLAGLPANNALLWGPRGTGKSSLIHALLNEFQGQGLKLIEVEREHLVDLPEILQHLGNNSARFIFYCDDLSFEQSDSSYKALKVILDGSLRKTPDNVLVYATSNRRHLMPEFQQDNLETKVVNTELHYGETVEEKISLSDRFGLWLSFHPFSQNEYLNVVNHWLRHFDMQETDNKETRQAALRWALERGSRSGRVAWQFACHWAGKQRLEHENG